MTTVRTIKLKRSSQAYGEPSGSADLSAPATPPEGGAETEAPPLAPSPEPVAPHTTTPEAAPITTIPGKFAVWFMLIALLAVIGLAIILGLQYSEMSFFKMDPSAWAPGK